MFAPRKVQVEPPSGESTRPTRSGTALLIALLALTAWAYRGVLHLGFTDTDALADVAAARVENLSGLLDQVREPLTAGVAGNNADFWRPVAMLQYAAQRALFGWEPLGWQVWDLCLHLLAITVMFWFVLAAGATRRVALVAAVVLALHPLGVEVVPAVARNLDLLFTLLGLTALLSITRGSLWVAILAGILAMGAKEVAVIILPVAVLWAACVRDRRDTWTLALAWGLAIPLFVLCRYLVLQGVGGYREGGETFVLDRLDALKWTFRVGPLELLFPGWTPQLEHWVPASLGLELSASLLLLAFIGAVLAWRRGHRLPMLGLANAVALLLLYAAAAHYSRRLLYFGVAALAMGVASMADHRWLRWVLAAWLLTLLPASPLWRPLDDWRRNDAITSAMTEDLADEYARLPQGAVLWVMDHPLRLDNDPRRRMLWRNGRSLNNTLAWYSLQAWMHDRLGRDDLRLRFINNSSPVGWMEEPRVSLEGEVIRVERPALERGWSRREAAEWDIEKAGDEVRLRRTRPAPDEWLLVAGAPHSVLVRLP